MRRRWLSSIFHCLNLQVCASPLPSVASPDNAKLSTILPSSCEDFASWPLSLRSVAQQTVQPSEVLLVASCGTFHEATGHGSNEGFLMLDTVIPQYDIHGYTWFFRPQMPKPIVGEKALTYLVSRASGWVSDIRKIRNLRLFLRVSDSPIYAGNNRSFGASLAKEEIIDLFDSDDLMRSTRIETIDRIFKENEDLEVFWHGYTALSLTQWARHILKEGRSIDDLPSLYTNNNSNWLVTYKELWKGLPLDKLTDGDDEPNETPSSYNWYIYRNFPFHMPKDFRKVHNGWVTLRKSVLETVTYPDSSRRQDAIFNWRVFRAKMRANFVSMTLGYYLRPW